jgi:transcriptional regulator with XRE-family HTH domain
MALESEIILRKTVKTDVPVFRDRLREALTDRDMSQRQLALSMGKDPRTVNHVFKGPVHPDLGTLKEFCQKLGVSADWLLGLSESKEESPQPQTLHRFACIDDIDNHEKRLFSTPSYSHRNVQYLAMAPMPSDMFEPIIKKEDLLAIDMSVKKITHGGCYVTSWANEPEHLYVNYMMKTVFDNVDKYAVKWLAGTKGADLGIDTSYFDPADLIVHGLVVGRYTDSVL